MSSDIAIGARVGVDYGRPSIWKTRVVKKNSQRPVAGRDNSGPRAKLAAETDELLSQIQGRVETLDSAFRIWHDYLSDRERSRLGGNLEDAWRRFRGTIGIVSHARKCTQAEALLWLCEETRALPTARIQSLRQELGLPLASTHTTASDGMPSWNKELGELSLGGKVIRRIRSTKVASRAVAILDAFEACGWCNRIENPLRSGGDHKMREAVYSLNRNLHLIRFESDGTSAGIRWRRR